MTRTLLVALFSGALLSACTAVPSGPAADGIAYEADRSVYAPQDSIVTTLANTSDADVGYNLCTAVLERRTGGGWTRVARTPERTCTLPLYVLHPDESATYREAASVVPGPGTYRLRARIETPVPGARRDMVTDPFTVRQ